MACAATWASTGAYEIEFPAPHCFTPNNRGVNGAIKKACLKEFAKGGETTAYLAVGAMRKVGKPSTLRGVPTVHAALLRADGVVLASSDAERAPVLVPGSSLDTRVDGSMILMNKGAIESMQNGR